jgi:hypothetical protein
MEYVYIGSVVAAGFLSVLLLALGGELRRQREVHSALNYFPGFSAAEVVFAGGSGLALDEGARAACLISSLGGQLKLTLVSFTDVVASEIISNGRRLLTAGRAAAAAPSSTGTEQVVFRIMARNGAAVDHAVVMPSMREAVHWHSLMKRIMDHGAAAGRVSTAAVVARPAPAAPPAVKAGAVPSRAPQAKAQPVPDDERVRGALTDFAREALSDSIRAIVTERDLRDACGVGLAIPAFHAAMNRLRRAKAIPGVAMSYSRQDESWRLSRRKG